MKLYLDDMRPVPEGWVLARSVNEAVALLKTGEVTEASLDHDLGIWSSEGGSGIKVVDWMAENDCWPIHGVNVHSANPVGRDQMYATIRRYAPY